MPESQLLIGLETCFKNLQKALKVNNYYILKVYIWCYPLPPQRTVCTLVKMLTFLDGPLIGPRLTLFERLWGKNLHRSGSDLLNSVNVSHHLLILMQLGCLFPVQQKSSRISHTQPFSNIIVYFENKTLLSIFLQLFLYPCPNKVRRGEP